MSNISKFLEDFQDMYVERTSNLYTDTNNLNSLELKFMDTYLDRLNQDIITLCNLTLDASEEAKEHYLNLLRILEDKIDYIGDTADVYNYVNSYFDIRTLRDVHNYNLRDTHSTTCLYDKNKRGITMKSLSALYNCSSIIEGNTITFFNTNQSYHSGIHLKSQYFNILKINQITIRKIDGTILELNPSFEGDSEYYINHESLESSQISVVFEPTVKESELQLYLNTVELNLIDYTYYTEGSVTLESVNLKASDLFTVIASVEQESNTYCSMNVGLEILDVNGRILDNTNITIPLNGTSVCKRLDKLNYNEVDAIEALIIKGKRTSSNLSREYLEELSFKNEKYVLYKPKDLLENKLNKYITKLGNTSFRVKSKIVKDICFSPTLELYSFNEKASPIIKYITGVTKNETI